MENIQSWELITDIGVKIREGWCNIFNQYKINFSISGIPSLSSYNFEENDLEIQTYITQEMLKKGFLASNRFYACISHTKEIQKIYFTALDEVMHSLCKMKFDKNQIINNLDGPVRQSGFKRLN